MRSLHCSQRPSPGRRTSFARARRLVRRSSSPLSPSARQRLPSAFLLRFCPNSYKQRLSPRRDSHPQMLTGFIRPRRKGSTVRGAARRLRKPCFNSPRLTWRPLWPSRIIVTQNDRKSLPGRRNKTRSYSADPRGPTPRWIQSRAMRQVSRRYPQALQQLENGIETFLPES